MSEAYDIIGDVHGCANTLVRLLSRMGYRLNSDGFYAHPERQAIFVGDVIDRGPRVRETLHIVKNMVDAGAAQCVMGNHEYNALGFTTPKPDDPECFLRDHSVHHNRLIMETLVQFAPYPDEWAMFLSWFQSLPIFLELPGCRVVHACWDQALIDQYKARYEHNHVDREFLTRSVDHTTFEGRFLDRLTRGTALPLPDGRKITSKDGHVRSIFRTKFWSRDAETYEDVVCQPDPLPEDMAKRVLSDEERKRILTYPADAPPVFVGHYWLYGCPRPLRSNVVCLDYSAVKYGRLVAYQFDGEASLDEKKFVWVHVDP